MATKYVEPTIVSEPEDDRYSALCVELGTASCGDTIDEAFHSIREAVKLHLSTLDELGERYFKGRGIHLKSEATPRKPVLELKPGAIGTRFFEPVGA